MKLPTRLRRKSATEDDVPQGERKKRYRFKRPKHIKRIIAGVVVLAIVGGVGFHFLAPKDAQAAQTYKDEAAARRDIQTTLTATGTLAPLNQYNVTTLARGEVLTCSFEEGDVVQKGDLLYTIDSSDVQDNIEKSRLSLQQSQLSYEQQLESLADLSVKSTKSGVITEVEIEVGDQVQQGAKIATVRDSATMLLKVPFNSSDAQTFYNGQAATVTLDGSFETLTGRVTAIDGADTVLTGNQIVRNVTIAVSNPGALSPSSAGTATINGIACNSGAAFEYNAETSITADVSGKVASLSIREGSTVQNGSVVAKLASTSLQNQIKNAELSLQSAQLSLQSTIDSLEDYNVTAPISGTIVTKNTKVGDSVDSSSGISALAVIYDMSALKFDIALDELDVNQVAVGQKVDVTVDALDGETFEGVITNISVAGTTANGATTYPVTVQIDDPPADLLPGMNINASIITGEVMDVIAVPASAVQRGDLVFVKDTSVKSTEKTEDSTPADDSAGGGKTAQGGASSIPDGYRAVQVETGLSDDDYIEIKSGLSEGDIVYVPEVTRSSGGNETAITMMPAGGMGSDMGGGMPSGGGAPSGGGMGGGRSGGGMP